MPLETRHLSRRGSLFEMSGDGRTVWINSDGGGCIARFGPGGIDIHHTVTAQMKGAAQCRHCTHGRPTQAEWVEFRSKVFEFYQVEVPESFRPKFLGD